MIFDTIDESVTPHLSVTDRMCLILFDLGITTRDQIKTITGWSDNRINDSIRRLRAKGGEKWIRSWQPKKRGPHVYALGQEGVKYARELRGETNDNRSPSAAHVWHYLGVNQILVRLLEAGLEVRQWLSGKESASWLYHQLLTRESGEPTPPKLPLRPDAMVAVGDRWWMLEYDTGTETPMRLSEKFSRYLDLTLILEMEEMPLLFVTVSERRAQTSEWAFQRAFSSHPLRPTWDKIFFLVEGQEPEFLSESLRE